MIFQHASGLCKKAASGYRTHILIHTCQEGLEGGGGLQGAAGLWCAAGQAQAAALLRKGACPYQTNAALKIMCWKQTPNRVGANEL
jgi:hypothetical protein